MGNWWEEKEKWRDERRKHWEKMREERRKWFEERGKYYREDWMNRYHSGRGRIWWGILILLIGIVALLKAMLFPIPVWLFTWQMFLIALGFFVGIRHGFRGGFWFLLMLIGGFFLIKDFVLTDVKMDNYLWPLILIVVGIFFIFRPRRYRHWRWKLPDDEKKTEPGSTPFADETTNKEDSINEDFVNSTSIFGGVKKNILSKNFKGGDIVNIFGGSEIDMSQADLTEPAKLELTQVFGGTKLIVPSNWKVKIESAAIFGGVEDKRSVQNTSPDPNKVLILTGTSIFAGIEIRSY
jgi:predicted membrane protein